MSEVSDAVAFGLISHLFNYRYDEIKNLPYSLYSTLLEQAFNIAGLYSGNGFEMQTRKDKTKSLQDEADMFKQFQKEIGVNNDGG